MKLSTFAFPADPTALAVIPTAPAVEKEKPLASIWGESMAAIQLRDTVGDLGQQFVVSRHIFLRRICPVREQRETKVAIWICQIMHFQTLELLRNLSAADQESRDDNHGPQIRWHPLPEGEPGQHPWPEQRRDLTIDQCDR